MKLTINGQQMITRRQSLKELLIERDFNIDEGGLAVAVNDTVIPKKQFPDYTLSDQDHIEIIRATQGG